MKNIIWFTNNLRVTDNVILQEASENTTGLIGVYFFDPRQFENTPFGFKKTGSFRAQFLIETVIDLKKSLAKLNIPLLVFNKKPEEIIPTLATKFQADAIYKLKQWTREEFDVCNATKNATNNNIQWELQYDQFLLHPDDVPFDSFEKIPSVFTNFRKKCEKYCDVRESAPALKAIDNKVGLQFANDYPDQHIPDLSDLHLAPFKIDKRSAFPFKGGETSGLQRVQNYIWESKNIATYKHTRNGLIGPEYSSKFSAWLANGSISARHIYWEVKKFEKEVEKNQDTYWMFFELFWRDYFKYISLKHGDLIFKIGGILHKDYDWGTSKDIKSQWIKGKTEYDFVNANMIEMAKTGWMSNRGRQNVASFWAKEKAQDWRIGASYFESMLIDYDVHSNWGNWMYNAGVGNDPRDRKFNIESQANRYDPNDEFTNLWIQ